MSNKDFVWTEDVILEFIKYLYSKESGVDWWFGDFRGAIERFKNSNPPFDRHAHSQQVYTEPRLSTEFAKKPPLGVIPEWLWREERLEELDAAIKRYCDIGKAVPIEWVAESYGLKSWLENREEEKRESEPHKEEKEWEIVEGCALGGGIHKWFPDNSHGGLSCVEQKCTIHSVRRLSDGEVFTVGETIVVKPSADFKKTITGFSIENGDLFVYLDWYNKEHKTGASKLYSIDKVKHPLFTTEDGKPVYDGDECWFVSDRLWIWRKVQATKSTFYGINNELKYFSTEAAAKEWVLMNKPCLSVEDVAKWIVDGVKQYPTLKELAKTKINQ